jgi:hypothetical protein
MDNPETQVCTLDSKKSLKIPKGNQNPYIEEEQTTQWPKKNKQKDKQRYIQNIHIKPKIE